MNILSVLYNLFVGFFLRLTLPINARAVLADRAAKSAESLNWQYSIVDLLKLIGMDSSLPARKVLAISYGYQGDTNDTATMNVWLIHQVMERISSGEIRV